MKKYKITVEGKAYEVEIEEINEEITPVALTPVSQVVAKPEKVSDTPLPKSLTTMTDNETPNTPMPEPSITPIDGEEVNAPMPGKILQLKIKEGDSVSEGDTLLILEAMKMENEIFANTAGKIKKINVSLNDMVDTGDVLVIIG